MSQNIEDTNWIDIVTNGVVGAKQRSTTLWERIHQNYSSHNPTGIERSLVSVQSRWCGIKKEAVRYYIYLQQIEDIPGSGPNEVDTITRAKKLYYDENKRSFGFDHCWEILEHVEIWKRLVNEEATKKSRVQSTSLSVSAASSKSPFITRLPEPEEVESNNNKGENLNPRLAGCQTEKESQPEKRKFEELLSTLLEVHKKKYIANEEKVKSMTTSNDIQSVTVDIASLTDPAKIEFYKMAQEVLERWRKKKI